MEIALLFSWFAFAIVVGVAANTRGRFGLGWFLLAVFISPLAAGLLLLALPRGSLGAPPKGPMKKCPHCAQMIPLEALVCHHCTRDVDTPESVEVVIDNENKRIERIKKERVLKARIKLIFVAIIIGVIAWWNYPSSNSMPTTTVNSGATKATQKNR